MTTTAILENDPDVLWIQIRTAIREGRLADAADAQRKLSDVGISIRINSLEVKRKSGGRPCTSR